MNKIKVLLVDDSLLACEVLKAVVEQDSELEVVAIAHDPYEAKDLIKKHNPDVITLDIEMPRMNGVVFLEKIVRQRPIPTIIVSGHTSSSANLTLRCLKIGAFDVLLKPSSSKDGDWDQIGAILREKIKLAAKSNVGSLFSKPENTVAQSELPEVLDKGNFSLIAIGASTGGVPAIGTLLQSLPKGMPGIVIVQHIPKQFSSSFAHTLDAKTNLSVVEATNGMKVESNKVIIAPGGTHLALKCRSNALQCQLQDTDKVNGHKPSVEVLFNSIEPIAEKTIAVMLTGMGNDGAEAMLSIRRSGAYTIAQDKETSTVWGMPGSAVELGAASQVLPLHKIGKHILNTIS